MHFGKSGWCLTNYLFTNARGRGEEKGGRRWRRGEGGELEVEVDEEG
jgi:hypothetical protein